MTSKNKPRATTPTAPWKKKFFEVKEIGPEPSMIPMEEFFKKNKTVEIKIDHQKKDTRG